MDYGVHRRAGDDVGGHLRPRGVRTGGSLVQICGTERNHHPHGTMDGDIERHPFIIQQELGPKKVSVVQRYPYEVEPSVGVRLVHGPSTIRVARIRDYLFVGPIRLKYTVMYDSFQVRMLRVSRHRTGGRIQHKDRVGYPIRLGRGNNLERTRPLRVIKLDGFVDCGPDGFQVYAKQILDNGCLFFLRQAGLKCKPT